MAVTRCDRTPAWAELGELYRAHGRDLDLRAAFAADAGRPEKLSVQAPHVWADLSKQLVDESIMRQLLALGQQCGVDEQRERLFAGATVNPSEGRAAMHWLLRHPAEQGDELPPALRAEHAQVLAVQQDMLAYAEQVRADAAITDVVHLGIGGSMLGPQLAVRALSQGCSGRQRLHFVSDLDGEALACVLRGLDPARTLFIVASKTFTTLETLCSARSARDWFVAQGGRDIARHFCALTTNTQAAAEFGITRCFGFWDWVGGRYSLWSAIGLPLAIAIGASSFRALLAGAHAMDRHFREAPLAANLPVLLALIDLWYRDFHGFGSRCVAPYAAGLAQLPAYLQQLEMESNGKRVDAQGAALPFATAPVVWGGPGIEGQHAYFQLLHQSSETVPLEFVVVRQATCELPGHQPRVLASALAQAQALMLGREDANGHRAMPGNRPSAFLVLDRLDPASLGALLALYEHRIFVQGALWGLNSFDQWGVELGKTLAADLLARLQSGDTRGLDGSTAALLLRLRGGG